MKAENLGYVQKGDTSLMKNNKNNEAHYTSSQTLHFGEDERYENQISA
jgi:hypothetical protein